MYSFTRGKKKSRYEFARALLIDYGAGRRNILLVVLLLLLLASCRALYPFLSCALLLRVHALVHWPVTWTNGRTDGQDRTRLWFTTATPRRTNTKMKLKRRRRRRMRPVAQTQTLICTPSVCAWSLEAFFRLVWPARSNQRHCPRADALSKEPVPANRLPICPRLPTDCTFFFFLFLASSSKSSKVGSYGKLSSSSILY